MKKLVIVSYYDAYSRKRRYLVTPKNELTDLIGRKDLRLHGYVPAGKGEALKVTLKIGKETINA